MLGVRLELRRLGIGRDKKIEILNGYEYESHLNQGTMSFVKLNPDYVIYKTSKTKKLINQHSAGKLYKLSIDSLDELRLDNLFIEDDVNFSVLPNVPLFITTKTHVFLTANKYELEDAIKLLKILIKNPLNDISGMIAYYGNITDAEDFLDDLQNNGFNDDLGYGFNTLYDFENKIVLYT